MTDNVLIGEPFKAPPGDPLAETFAVYQIGHYGRRIVPVNFTDTGQLKAPRVKNCIHGRPLIPRMQIAGDDYAQVCQLCAFESERLAP